MLFCQGFLKMLYFRDSSLAKRKIFSRIEAPKAEFIKRNEPVGNAEDAEKMSFERVSSNKILHLLLAPDRFE